MPFQDLPEVSKDYLPTTNPSKISSNFRFLFQISHFFHIFSVNMSGYSSGGEDDWMQIQGFIRVNPVSKEEFDLRPFFFNHPMVLPYAPMELCSYCGKDGLVRCSRCRIWYCGETCQKNHWPKHKLECRPPPPLEKRDG